MEMISIRNSCLREYARDNNCSLSSTIILFANEDDFNSLFVFTTLTSARIETSSKIINFLAYLNFKNKRRVTDFFLVLALSF